MFCTLVYTTFSNSLSKMLKSEMGLYFFGKSASSSLYIGITFATFNKAGKTPVFMDLLNTITNAGIISFLTNFKVLMLEMSIVAFVVLNWSNSFSTSL